MEEEGREEKEEGIEEEAEGIEEEVEEEVKELGTGGGEEAGALRTGRSKSTEILFFLSGRG